MHKTNREILLSPFSKTKGGANVPHKKNTAEYETVIMPAPERVYLPMLQHIGTACTPTVNKGEHVCVGQTIGDSEKYLSAPVHASVSGTVESISEVIMPSGAKTECVVIVSDGLMTPYKKIKPHQITSRDDLIEAARNCGLVGLGGAGFPTHVKLKSPPDKHIDTLIINAAECEPYITVDYRECIENAELLMESIYILLDFMAIDKVIIAIEDNKPKAIEILSSIAANKLDKEDRVKVMKLRSSYPQGAEKVLIKAVTGRKVPIGKLPADIGCAVMNVTSVTTLGRYIKTGMPLVSRRITVDGSAIKEAKNILVPLGTPISDIIDFCGGYNSEPGKILMGGPMMGIALIDDTMPLLKQNNAILVLSQKDARTDKKESACIRCGRCVASCPMSLMPTLVERCIKLNDVSALSKTGIGVCMECGSCAYNCPAQRPLVQYMRMAKQLDREAKNSVK